MIALTDLLRHLPGCQLHSRSDVSGITIRLVCADSRSVAPGALFVAVKGTQADGHRYLPDIEERGAVAAMGALSPRDLAALGITLPAALPYVQVTDSRHALAVCAAALHGFPSRDLTVIGVTGTDGKTTTCTALAEILKAATRAEDKDAGRVGLITTVAAQIRGQEMDTGLHVTTPDAPEVQSFLAQMRDAGCRYAVIESTSHGLDQGRVAAVEFDVAAVTNITHEHLDYHGSRPAYVQAKAKLFRALYASPAKPGAPRCAVLNADDAGSFSTLEQVMLEEAQRHGYALPVLCYGMARDPETAQSAKLDVMASNVTYDPGRTFFSVNWWGGAFELETHLIGEFNVYNLMCASAIALALGIAPDHVRAGVAGLAGVPGRMERIDRGQPFLAVVDFAHSPASLERALLTLRPLVGRDEAGRQGRLIAVFGCAGLRDREKRRLMGRVSGRLADVTVITAEDPRTEDLAEINRAIADGVREFAAETDFVVIPDRAHAIAYAVDMARPGDVVAAFGKGHERSMCFGVTEYPWSDQQAMSDALERRVAGNG